MKADADDPMNKSTHIERAEPKESDPVVAAMAQVRGTERAVLISLAATIAAGIEADAERNHWLPSAVAERAVSVAREIVKEVTKP